MKCLDLFSGIGGISLGLESSGMKTVAFCEIEPYPRYWLEQHWSGVPIYEDVRTLTAESILGDVGRIDIIAGGFPCPDISAAGRGAGLGTEESPTERSGLWFEALRIVREMRPRWCLFENVPHLRTRGYDTVRHGLLSEDYSCWPFVVGAGDIGAPYKRKRVWIIARDNRRDRKDVGEPSGEGLERFGDNPRKQEEPKPRNSSPHSWPARMGNQQYSWEAPRLVKTHAAVRADDERDGIESSMGNATDGVPGRMARFRTTYTPAHRKEAIKALGNAVVPLIAGAIGRSIMRMDAMER